MENNFLKLKESQTIELKQSTNGLPSSIFETYSSFANTKGGKIYLGIKEGKESNNIIGVNNPSALKKDFFNTISNKTKVSSCLGGDELWKQIDFEGKTIVEISVPEAPRALKPIYLNGNPVYTYVRRSDGDYLASEYERKSMELDSFAKKMDMQPNKEGILFVDLNQETIKSYRAMFNEQNPSNMFLPLDDISFFKNIGALSFDGSNYVPTNAAVALFGNYLQIKRIYPEYNMDYRENISRSSRWDYRLDASDFSWSGNIFDFIFKTITHIKPLLPNRFRLSDGINESGGRLLLECVREGIVNAVSNCDFLLSGGVCVIYEGNKITFKNAGRMHLPLPVALLGGDSDPRNEGIMNLLHLVKIGDKAGTGIPNIVLKMKELSYPEPLWDDNAFPSRTTLTLILPPPSISTNNSDLNNKILYTLTKLKQASVVEIAKEIGVSSSTVSIALKELKAKNVVNDNGKLTKGKLFFLND